jgi:hypothetical protein
MVSIFIAYAQEDREAARDLASRLKELGMDPWLDVENLYPGDNWALETGVALEVSDAMVALASKQAMGSERFRQDLQYAQGAERFEGRLFVALVGPEAIGRAPWFLRELSFGDESLESLARRVALALVQRCEETRA